MRFTNDPHLGIFAPESLTSFDAHAKAFAASFAKVEDARTYAIDENSERAGVSLARAVWEGLKAVGASEDGQLVKVLRRVAPAALSSTQSWRPGPEKPLPKQWLNPITGEPLRNPWLLPKDQVGQEILLRNDPALAASYKDSASNPYRFVQQLKDEKANRETLRSIKYGRAEHENNPFRLDGHLVAGAVQKQNAFIREHSKAVVEVWDFEKSPVIWPWGHDGNMTQMTACQRALMANPVEGVAPEVVPQAAAIDRGILEAQRAYETQVARLAAERAAKLTPTH